MKKFITVSFLFLIFCFFSGYSQTNLVFILGDDCTHWDIGCYGSRDSHTPNIDKLASQGIKFNRCYQAAPMCSPTRHNIYTGIYPVKTGAYPNHTRALEGTECVVQYLKPLGYRVAFSGKTHISPEEIFAFEYLGKSRNPDFEKVETFLQEVKKDQTPFALFLCSSEPHTPWDKGDPGRYNPEKISLPPHYADTKETREAYCRYLAEINYLDSQVGKAMKLISSYGFEQNTLVIFASEQGNSFPFAKWTLYEAGVKSALIARMPGVITPGSQSDAIVEYGDILPTFIQAAGGKIPEKLDGKSLFPLFRFPGGEIKKYSYSIQTSRGIFHGSDYYGIRAVVNENFRYILNLTPDVAFLNAVNNNPKKTKWYLSWEKAAESDPEIRELITKYMYRPKEELYNIKEDKWCQNNLAEDPHYDAVKKELNRQLVIWMEECGDTGQETELKALENMPKYIKK